jgi:YHS domain-containing protein
VVRNPAPLNLVPTWKIENAVHIQPRHPEIHTGFVRRRCRNPRCGGKLRQETSNPRNAFCCHGCFEQHYRKLCLVCERPLRRKAERKAGRPTQFCSPKCKFAFRRHPERFLDVWVNVPAAQRNTPRSAHKSGLKTRAKGRPTWRVVAGPAANLDPINLAVPLSPETVARVRRANARAWVDTTEIATPAWPVILVSGSDHEHELVHRDANSTPSRR